MRVKNVISDDVMKERKYQIAIVQIKNTLQGTTKHMIPLKLYNGKFLFFKTHKYIKNKRTS